MRSRITSKRRAPGEGSVYQRKDGRWVAALTLGAGVRKSFYRATRAEAVLALQEAHQANMQGTLISMREETLETFLTRWLHYQILPTVRERTYRTYQQTIQAQVLPSLGSFILQKLTHWHLLRFYHHLRRQHMAPTTIQKTHRILHHALEDAVKWGHITRNVAQFVELPAVQKRPRVTQALSGEQAYNLLIAAQNDPLEALYVLALTTGMRQGELLALKWSDLDLTQRKLQVRRTLIGVRAGQPTVAEPKSPTSRRCIHLTDLAVQALHRHLLRQKARARRQRDTWVFCDEQGVPLRVGSLLRQSFQPLLAKAGLPRIRFHDLRHSTATLLLTIGVHPKIVQELLGHSQIFVTLDIYSHILPTLQEEAMHRLNELLTGPRKSPLG